MSSTNLQFNPLRSAFWPVYRHEIKKLMPLLIMLFLLSFNQSALWNLKDSLVITTSGAEVIPFIKVWAILPSAILFTWIFTSLSNRYSQEKVYYLITGAFLLFYALFAFLIYPYRDQLHPFETAGQLENLLPAGFKGMISMYRYWTFTLFYVMCELWNTVVISVLFWSFVNQITHLSEARRFYSVLSVAYNVAVVAAGMMSIVIAHTFTSSILAGHDLWEQTLMLSMLTILISGLLAMGTFRWMHKNLQKEIPSHNVQYQAKEKTKLSLFETIRYVSQSKYLISIAIVVVAYSLTINLVEVVWKDQIKNLYPKALDYNHYVSNLQIIQGLLAVIISFGVAEWIKRFGWTKTALITPVLMTFTCLFFFGILFFQDHLTPLLIIFGGISPLTLIVFFGAAQNCLSKGCKYSVYDSTKEIAYLPLSDEGKLKGKTIIDGVGVRLGKSGGSMIHQGLLILFTSVSASAPYVAAILLVVLLLWMIAIYSLGKGKEMSVLQEVKQLQPC